MKTSKFSLSLAALAGFLVGCAVVYFIWSRGTAPVKTSAPNQSQPQVAQTQAANAAKSPESAVRNTQTQPALRGAEARIFLNEIKRDKAASASVNVNFFASRNGKLSQQFIDFFELTPAEASQLSDLIQTTRTEMWKAANAQAQVLRTATGGVVVKIPPATAGPDIYDKVMDGFQSVLGNDRFNDMMLYNGRQFDYVFNQFGGEERVLTIEPRNDGQYNIGISNTEPNGGSVSQTMELTLDQIKKLHPEWVEFVPGK